MFASIIFAYFGIAFLALGVPIAVCLGFGSSIAVLASGKDWKLTPVMMFDAIDSYILIAIPFFILAGNIMARGGMAKRIFDFSNAIVGWMRGGLGAVNVVGSMIFGGMSGSATADAGGLGIIEIQEMVRYKYPLKYSAGITLVTSCLSSAASSTSSTPSPARADSRRETNRCGRRPRNAVCGSRRTGMSCCPWQHPQ